MSRLHEILNKAAKAQNPQVVDGACCVKGVCRSPKGMNEDDCRGLGGIFYPNKSCREVDCNTPPKKTKAVREVANEHLLPVGQWVSLKADDSEYDRGLVCRYNEDGSYDIKYWYEDTDNIMNFELEADGDSVGESVRAISVMYHEELKDDED